MFLRIVKQPFLKIYRLSRSPWYICPYFAFKCPLGIRNYAKAYPCINLRKMCTRGEFERPVCSVSNLLEYELLLLFLIK